jgi:hypothetical protein
MRRLQTRHRPVHCQGRFLPRQVANQIMVSRGGRPTCSLCGWRSRHTHQYQCPSLRAILRMQPPRRAFHHATCRCRAHRWVLLVESVLHALQLQRLQLEAQCLQRLAHSLQASTDRHASALRQASSLRSKRELSRCRLPHIGQLRAHCGTVFIGP